MEKYQLNRIGIYGSSSGRNAGDAALIGAIMDAVDDATGRRLTYDIPTLRPSYITNEYPNDALPVSMLPWHGALGMFSYQGIRSFRRCDLNIVYDNMMFDKKLWHPYFNYMPAVWWLFRNMKRQGQRLGMYNVGCGPVTTSLGRRMLKETADVCDFITVRDQDSFNLLRELGVTHERILVTADAALTLKPSSSSRVKKIFARERIPLDRELLAFNVNSYLGSWSGTSGSSISKEEFCSTYANAVRRIYEELKTPILFVATQHSDIEVTEGVRSQLGASIPNYLLSNVAYNHADMKGALGAVGFLFAMRLHANILATSMHTPAVALSFQKKVTSYYSELGLQQNILSFDNFSVDSLVSHVLDGWRRRHDIRRVLQTRIPELQAKALVTSSLIAQLANGASAEEAVEYARSLFKTP